MDRLLPRLLGDDLPYVNLDNAASTPVMAEVWEAVEAFAPWYSSVHRGSGYKSQAATAAFEAARGDVARFVGARRGDDVVFVRNTTEAINVLSASLPAGTRVLTSAAARSPPARGSPPPTPPPGAPATTSACCPPPARPPAYSTRPSARCAPSRS